MAIGIPSPTEEAVRDLCRMRGDMVEDLTRARNRLSRFLLRHSRVWRCGSPWTHKHEAWLGAQRFAEPALATTFGHYRAGSRPSSLSPADWTSWCRKWPRCSWPSRWAGCWLPP